MKWITPLLVLIGFIPYLAQIPYIIGAHRYSRLDRFDWIFIVLGAILFSLNYRRMAQSRPKRDFLAYTALLVSAVGIGVGIRFQINAVTIAGSLGFAWATIWTFLGWRGAFFQLLVFAILGLGITSSTYWISYVFSCQIYGALGAKFILAILLAFFDFLSRRYSWLLRRNTLCFCLALMGAGLLFLQSGSLAKDTAPFVLDITSLRFGDYLGRNVPLDDDAKRFFRQSEAKQFSFANDETSFSVLSVNCSGDIHEIHPASHCLRTSGAQIWAEYSSEEMIGQEKLRFTEIIASMASGRLLVWVWYSSSRVSTGDFLSFRRAWRPNENWHTFQLSTPGNDLEQARASMTKFLEALRQANPATPRLAH